MLFKRNVASHEGLCEQDAVLEVDVPVRHAVGQEKGFPANIWCTIDQASFLISAIVFGRKRKSHVTFRVCALCYRKDGICKLFAFCK